MKQKPRWMRSVIEAAKDEAMALPSRRREPTWTSNAKSHGKPGRDRA